jgi:hypothetical protein
MRVQLVPLDKTGIAWAQTKVLRWHYLHQRAHPMSCVEGYAVQVAGIGRVGCLLVGRPQAQRCYPWYGSVADVATGKAEVTRWQVLNLARVWLHPEVQGRGAWVMRRYLPGFEDRHGVWRSALASTALRLLVERVGYEYLLARPPCFLDEAGIETWRIALPPLTAEQDQQVRERALYNQRSIAYRAARRMATTVHQLNLW